MNRLSTARIRTDSLQIHTTRLQLSTTSGGDKVTYEGSGVGYSLQIGDLLLTPQIATLVHPYKMPPGLGDILPGFIRGLP